MCKHAVKKSLHLLRYVPDQYKTQQMCYKAILESHGRLKYVPDCYSNQEMFNNAVDNGPHALEFLPEQFMTQKMYNKADNRCFLYLILFLINMKLKKCVTELLLKIFFS